MMHMKKILFAAVITATVSTCFSQRRDSAGPATLIPAPVSAKWVTGESYPIRATEKIYAGTSKDVLAIAQLFATALNHSTIYKATAVAGNASTGIRFVLDPTFNGKNGAYSLNIGASGVALRARDAAGIFYGMQTLMQLLPAAVEAPRAGNVSWSVPFTSINDEPRFAWRGLMLDVARHFLQWMR